MMDDQHWHYVRRNETTRQPRRHIFLDTEARTERRRKGHEQSWRCGVATFRDAPKGKAHRESTVVYRSPEDLWRDVTEFVPRKGRVILWTHNLGYDVRTSRMLTILPALHWKLTAQNLTPGGTWLVWRRGDQSLTMVDSAAVFPTGIAELAKHFQTTKLPLPDDGASEDQWVRRCARDVQIMRDAIVSYLDRLESDDLGNWQMTGTGQAWAAFRHRHLTHDMLVHWDEDARAAERRAMWTGRCEAYWHGRVHHVRVDEWDMTLAYPRIARECAIPTALVSAFGTDTDLTRWLSRDGYAVLAEVEVSTDEPLVPMERDGRICWPVGTFRTTLWDPEIRLLAERGAVVRLVRGWAYRAEPALASWAEWIIGQLEAPDDQSPAWWKIIMKHWARALIGRMSMTYREWEHVASTGRPDVRRATYVDTDTGETGELIQVGREMFLATTVVEWAESMVHVTGWIQSQCRATLAVLLREAGERTVLYADTDSMLTTGEHYDTMAAIAARHPQAGLRLKRSWASVEIRGPRQLITGERVRVSGVSKRAQRLPDGTLQGEVWESLEAAITNRRATSVRITPRRWHLRAVDSRRTAGADGWTVPIRIGVSAEPAGLVA